MTLPALPRKISVLVGLALLSGMASGCKTLDKMERENYQSACDNLGIARGTPTYDQCMLQQQALSEESTQRSLDRSAEREAAKKISRY